MSRINAMMSGLKIGDLINEEGVMFEIGDQFGKEEMELEDSDEEFPFSPHVQFTNEEMLNMLNMNEFEDEDDDSNEKGPLSVWAMNFSKLKTKMQALTEDEKVMKYVKQQGVGDCVPTKALATIHYIGFFEYRDEPFDSTYHNGKPRSFRLDQGCMITGLEIALKSMRKHEIAMFLIHPDLAYKSTGCPPRIPPNEDVLFVVHLIDFIDNGYATTYYELDYEERCQFKCVIKPVTHMLVSAKDYFTKLDFKRAIKKYREAVECLEKLKLEDSLEEEKMNELLSRAYTNLGLCYNKENLPLKACIALRQVPNPTAKSHYHFGKALLVIGEYDDAMKEFQKASALEPRDEAIKKAIQTTNTKQREYQEIEKRLWKNCFECTDKYKNTTAFREAARDLCNSIIEDNTVLRQSLSEGFTKEEIEIVQEEAAISGLDVVTSTRNGKETVYLQKQQS